MLFLTVCVCATLNAVCVNKLFIYIYYFISNNKKHTHTKDENVMYKIRINDETMMKKCFIIELRMNKREKDEKLYIKTFF
jgi:hypothetical protein